MEGTGSRGERSRDIGSDVSECRDGVEEVVERFSEQNRKVSVESRKKTELAIGRVLLWVRRRVLYVGLSLYGTEKEQR